MASKTHATTAIALITINLLFITFVSSNNLPCPTPPLPPLPPPPPKDSSYTSTPPKPYYPETPPPPKDYSYNRPPPKTDHPKSPPPPNEYSYTSPPKPYSPISPSPPKDYSYTTSPPKTYNPAPPPEDYRYTSPPKPYYPKPSPPPHYYYPKETCSIDILKFGTCANPLDFLVTNGKVGTPPEAPTCCSLVEGLDDFEAALCLCTALKGNVLGFIYDISLKFSLLCKHCQREVPFGFQCGY
ncbi:extensin-3-like [Coffea eugenioides]|uniref:extensin-3-like n=1 Tax=Coffea eugenioides TaxID=49369 RepID=UPI000F609FA0|nr:extensin-3-like [Coffea eugenioides]